MATRDIVLSDQTVVAAANRRDKYLFDTLGLNHDPFAFSSAELELQADSEDPPFFSYFVDLPIKNNRGLLLEALKQPGHAIVYGVAGSGKTTFRYALEAQCRALTEHILVVSQPVGKGEPNSNTATSIPIPSLSTFIEALATDLFVQTLEQFDTLTSTPDLDLTTKLSHFWHQHIPNFHRNLERHLHQEQPSHASVGISIWWRTWKRHIIRYTPLTPARTRFLEHILTLGKKVKKITPSHLEALEQGGSLAQQLGYHHIYYLIDVADNPQLNVQQLMDQFQDMASWSTIITKQIAFSLKVFLPEQLKHIIENHPIRLPNPLISPSFSAIILWQDTKLLQTLIANRFRSAGSWIQGIEVLVSQDISTELPQKLIEAAHHSPRRLLQIINLLINIHADREPDDPTILFEDWQQLCKSWSYDPPRPSPLMTNVYSTEGKIMTNGIYDIRRPFEETLYVERQEETNKAQGWKNSNRRVLTVTSPPASGKTWFLNYFQQILHQEERQHTFRIDVNSFLSAGSVGYREINPIALQTWLSLFAKELHTQCNSVPSINDYSQTAAILTTLANHISELCWPGEPIYLFVDGGDEPSHNSWKVIERQILEPILTNNNWRLIIALRQSQRLYFPLSRNTEQSLELSLLNPLPIDKFHPGHEQLRKLIEEQEKAGQLAPPLGTILAMLPAYNWIHPGLNHFLFLEAYNNYNRSGGIYVQPNLMERGIIALTTLAEPKQIINGLLTIYQNLDPNEWGIEDIELTFGKSRREAWSIITTLQTYLLIANTANRYRITNGVREFIHATQDSNVN